MPHGSLHVATSAGSQPRRQHVVADAEYSPVRLLAQAPQRVAVGCLKDRHRSLDLQTRVTSGHVEEPCVIPTKELCSETDSLSADRAISWPRSDTLAFGVDMALMLGMPEHSRHTVTASDPRKKRWLEDPEPPIALRAWSTSIGNQEHELDLGQTTYLCGAHPDCAIVIDDPQISSRHALFERRGGVDRAPTLRVRDTGSKNGTRLRGERLASFDVTAGQPFELGRSVTVLPMSEAMRVARRRLFNVYGSGTPELPLDRLLIEALGNGNLLVLGGGGHQELARAVHDVSPRRTVPPELASEVPTGTSACSDDARSDQPTWQQRDLHSSTCELH
jgi:FHA domain